MNLANYQKDIVSQIYLLLVSDDQNRGITLYGDTGSGKSTIARGVAERLQEGWSVFYIEGIDSNLSPYLTWNIGTRLYSKRNLNLGREISLGISFIPALVSLELGALIQRDEKNYILTESEEAIISAVKKQAGANPNILFIADNYELWDIPSKQLLQKIVLPQVKLMTGFHVTVLITSHEQVSIESGLRWDIIPIPEISDDDIHHVLRQKNHSGKINIREIRLCAGNDLSLALMAADYFDNNDIPPTNFKEVLDKRYKGLSSEEHEACKILEPLSILDSYFTKDETAFFINPYPQDEIELEFQAGEYLALAEEQMFISGEECYCFTSNKVKDYFNSQLSKKDKLYHRKFANYLQKRQPEDYYSRGKHLKLSLQLNDTKIILEAWQLLFLSYIRRATETGNLDDIYSIISDINALLEQLNPRHQETQKHILAELLNGYKEFSMHHYTETLFHLQSITESKLIPACLSEIKRTILLCYSQLAENPATIQQIADDLYDTINDSNFMEDEQYCRAALVLMAVYLDRATDMKKVRVLHNRLLQTIRQHPDSVAFEEFEACHDRKAALYYTAVIAMRQTDQSIKFYRNHHNRSGLYMALCNHSGNAIIAGNYIDAERALVECTDILEHSNGMHYPSKYKVENNKTLLTYLQEERKAAGNRNQIICAAKKAAASLLKIVNDHQDEVSHVILLNYLGLAMLCDLPTWHSELANANLQLSATAEYYQYFLHDLNYANALLHDDYDTARTELTILKKLKVPLLSDYETIFSKRQHEQELLLENPSQLCGDPWKYHEKISGACAHVQDASCHFYGRGFLLSDLQFLSF